jgi:hypothetical protein
MCPSFKDRFLSPVRGGEGRGAHCKEQAAFILPNLVQHAVLVRHPLLSRLFLTLRLMRIVLRFLQQRLERLDALQPIRIGLRRPPAPPHAAVGPVSK